MLGFDKAQEQHDNEEKPYTAPTAEANICEICGVKCNYKMCDDCYNKAVKEKAVDYIASSENLMDEYFEYSNNKFDYCKTYKAKSTVDAIRREFINEDRTHFEVWYLSRRTAGEG